MDEIRPFSDLRLAFEPLGSIPDRWISDPRQRNPSPARSPYPGRPSSPPRPGARSGRSALFLLGILFPVNFFRESLV